MSSRVSTAVGRRGAGDQKLVLTLMIGAVFWNFLSIVFGFIAETVAWERWEGTLEYTFMAAIRRRTQLLGSTVYAVLYGLVHTFVMLIVLVVFFGLDLTRADPVTPIVFLSIGSL